MLFFPGIGSNGWGNGQDNGQSNGQNNGRNNSREAARMGAIGKPLPLAEAGPPKKNNELKTYGNLVGKGMEPHGGQAMVTRGGLGAGVRAMDAHGFTS